MKKKAILFDMDGTLVDTVDDLTTALNHTLKTLNFATKTREQVQSYLGNGIVALVELGLPDDQKDQLSKAAKIFKEYYKDHLADFTKPYNGIVELIDLLKQKNYRLAVISNKIQPALDELVTRFFSNKFEQIIGQRNDLKQKPYPNGVNLALQLMGVDKDDALYVGDSDVDLKTAQNAKLDCVSCSWGFKTKAELISYGAKIIIDKPMELLNHL
ncbi:MAG: HAD-IA family hydrolase [Clostridiales bacterium]|nr:HAD-IA family hydrolase [Clostridiales bacterium]